MLAVMRNKLTRFVAGTLGLALLAPTSGQIENAGALNAWTTKPVSRAHNSSNKASYVKTVRATKHGGVDRVLFEFEGPFPNYRIKYLKSRFYDGEGGRERIKSPGNRFVQVEFFVIPASEEQLKFTEAKNFAPKGKLRMPSLQSVTGQGLFEGFYAFLLGVSARKPYRVTELANPSRLVIDFQH